MGILLWCAVWTMRFAVSRVSHFPCCMSRTYQSPLPVIPTTAIAVSSSLRSSFLRSGSGWKPARSTARNVSSMPSGFSVTILKSETLNSCPAEDMNLACISWSYRSELQRAYSSNTANLIFIPRAASGSSMPSNRILQPPNSGGSSIRDVFSSIRIVSPVAFSISCANFLK